MAGPGGMGQYRSSAAAQIAPGVGGGGGGGGGTGGAGESPGHHVPLCVWLQGPVHADSVSQLGMLGHMAAMCLAQVSPIDRKQQVPFAPGGGGGPGGGSGGADGQNDPSASAIWPAATCLLPGPPQPGQVPPGRKVPATGAVCPFLTA